MRIQRQRIGWAAITALVLSGLLMITCSEKIVNNRLTTGNNIRIETKLSPTTAAALSIQLFRLTVTGPGMDPVRVFLHPADNAGTLVGEAEIPYGISRKFVVEADQVTCYMVAPICDTVPLFQGETVTDVNPGVPLDLGILLVPVVPMIRLSPKFLKVTTNVPFEVDVWMYNIDSLAEISGTISAQDGVGGYYYYMLTDTLIQPPDVNPSFNMSRDGNYFGYWQEVIQIPVLNHGNTGKLVRGIFTIIPDTGTAAVDTLSLTVNINQMYKLNGDTIGVASIYNDNAMIELHRPAQ